jgi:hypothetical protein
MSLTAENFDHQGIFKPNKKAIRGMQGRWIREVCSIVQKESKQTLKETNNCASCFTEKIKAIRRFPQTFSITSPHLPLSVSIYSILM